MRRPLALCIGLLAGCLSPDLVECPGGVSCPAGTRCDPVHSACATPEQFDVCAMATPLAPCEAGPIAGACYDGVCLPTGCGNSIVDTDEQCDDGNLVSGDGCSQDCRSTEVCGNGEIDPGEPCDDGNLRSRDGCDSLCGVEAVQWTTTALAPLLAVVGAFDEARGRLVITGYATTWELDGLRWSVTDTSTSDLGGVEFPTLLYHPGRQRVLRIVGAVGPARVEEWTGITWDPVATVNAPMGPIVYAVYDPTTGRIFAATPPGASGKIYTLDAAFTWSAAPPPPAPSIGLAYDPVDQVVLSASANNFYKLGTTSWIDAAVFPEALQEEPGLQFVIYQGELWAAATRLYVLRGGQWVQDQASLSGISPRVLYVDPVTDTLRVAGSGRTWVHRTNELVPLPIPDQVAKIVTHPNGIDHVLVSGSALLNVPVRAWTLDATGVGTARDIIPERRDVLAAVRAPARNAIILQTTSLAADCGTCPGSAGVTWTLDPTGATRIGVSAPTSLQGRIAASYDPDLDAIVAESAQRTYVLPDTATTWTMLEETAPPIMTSMTYDPVRQRTVAAVREQTTNDYDLYSLEAAPIGWSKVALAPDGSFYAVADERAGSLLWIEQSFGTQIWQSRGDTWALIDPLPYSISITASAYAPATGELALLGYALEGVVVLARSYQSLVPTETCGTIDDDGDGRIGCDDPDCDWTCAP